MAVTSAGEIRPAGLDLQGGLVAAAAKRALPWLTAYIVGCAVNTAAVLALPTATGSAIDSALRGSPTSRPLAWLGVVLAAAVASDALTGLASSCAAASAVTWLRRALTEHVLAIGAQLAERFAGGDLVSRFVSGTSNAADAPATLIAIAVSFARGVGAVTALWLIYWPLGAVFLLGLPLGLAVLSTFLRRTSNVNTTYQELVGLISTRFVDALGGVRTIRAAGTERQEIERILSPVPDLRRCGLEMWRANATAAWLGSLLMPVILIAILAVAGVGVAAGRLAPGQMIAASGYALVGFAALSQSGMFARLGRNRAGARRVAEILAAPAPPAGDQELPPGPGRLELRGVSVRRGQEWIIRDVDMTVPAGYVVAIVGRSGAGKSALAAVAGRLTDPDEGEVRLDGVALSSLTGASLRTAISYAFERPVLFGQTVAEVIACAGQKPREQVELAARLAEIDPFVRRLPEQYATRMAGLCMSGGEAQRLGLARTLAQGGRLLILDDATSSLDMVTEAQVTGALARARGGCTQLVVAHRASTAARCDLVAWLEDGRVRACQPHRVLWQDPSYRAIFGRTQPQETQPS